MWHTWLWEASAPLSGPPGTTCMGMPPETLLRSIFQRCGHPYCIEYMTFTQDIVAVIHRMTR